MQFMPRTAIEYGINPNDTPVAIDIAERNTNLYGVSWTKKADVMAFMVLMIMTTLLVCVLSCGCVKR